MNIDSYKIEFDKSVEYLKNEFGGLRSSRATPALVENIQIEVYGSLQALKGLASLSVPDAKTILVEPWDKSIVKEIEKAILSSGAGLNPVNEGSFLRIVLPPMTEENRRELLKLVSVKAESARVKIRNIRDKARNSIQEGFKNKEITEDEKYKLQEKLDKMVADYNQGIESIREKKEKEIMTV